MLKRRVIELVFCSCSVFSLGFFLGWSSRGGSGLDGGQNLIPGAKDRKITSSSSPAHANAQDLFDAGEILNARAQHQRPLIDAQSVLSEITRIQQIQGTEGLREHVNFLDRLAVSDTPKIAKELLAGRPTAQQQQALHLVLDAMAWKNPKAAWEFATGLPPNCLQRNAAINSAIVSLTSKDPGLALQLIQSLDDKILANQLRKIALVQTAAKSPRLALTWLNPQEKGDFGLLGTIFNRWAKINPQEALDATSSLPGEASQMATSTVLSAIADSDPVAAWHQAQQFVPKMSEQFDPRVRIIQAWTRQDAAAAASAAVGIPQQNTQRKAIMAAISAWADQDFQGALDFAQSLQNPSAKSDALVALANKGQPSNHKALLEEILEHVKPGESFQRAISTLFSHWSAEAPEQAAQAIMHLPPGRLFSNTASLVASNWASRQAGSPQMLQWALSLPQGEARNRTVAAIMQSWASNNPSEAASAASKLGGRERLAALSQIAEKWTSQHPQSALDWATRLPSQEERQKILEQILSTWALKNPSQAAQLALQFDGKNDAALTRSVVSTWASQDLEKAADWALSLPAGPKKDTALQSLAEQIAYEDPAMAMNWATSINDPRLRERSIAKLAREWLRHDTANARAWLASAPISEETRQRILRR